MASLQTTTHQSQANATTSFSTTTPAFVFTNEAAIDEELKCPVCLDIYPPDAVCCSSCMNIFCKICVESQQRCPLCRSDPRPFQKIPLPLRNIIAKLNVDCMACSKTAILRGDFDHHVQHSCPFTCPYGCEKKITRATLSVHENECSQKLVPCTGAELGCSFQISRAKLSAHVAGCPYVILSPLLTRQKKENRELLNLVTLQNKRIRDLESEIELERDCRSQKRQKITRANASTDFPGYSEWNTTTNSGPIIRQHPPPTAPRPGVMYNMFSPESSAVCLDDDNFQEFEEFDYSNRSATKYPFDFPTDLSVVHGTVFEGNSRGSSGRSHSTTTTGSQYFTWM